MKEKKNRFLYHVQINIYKLESENLEILLGAIHDLEFFDKEQGDTIEIDTLQEEEA